MDHHADATLAISTPAHASDGRAIVFPGNLHGVSFTNPFTTSDRAGERKHQERHLGDTSPTLPTILWDGDRMASGRQGSPMAEIDKSEKITINVGLVDLGQIDLLVSEGFYANRTDFIRTAIRRQLESRAEAVNNTVARRALTLGTQHLSRRDLEGLRDAGQTVDLHVLGLATIANDVSADLALATISSVEVLGAFRAPKTVKAALANRTTN
jgi:Arc/MetJ-type ribon-helix-helix transcriptional regulator